MYDSIETSSRSEAKRARLKLAGRRRRVIFNDDTNEFVHEGANTPEGFLAPRLAPLAGTSVDTICWSVLADAFDAPSYDSKLQPIYGDAHDTDVPSHLWSEPYCLNLKAMIKSGICPLQVVIDFAHANGMEAFASVRMNDCHDSFVPGGQTIWKLQHPELKVDTQGVLSDMELYVTAWDFSHEEVRGRKLEIIEEICQRYDVDGFELDYIRHPAFFSRTLRGLPVTDEQVQIMTSFMGRIRQITDQAAARRGRPILIATRVPDSFELSTNIGLDLNLWLKEDLVDILIAGGGYAPFTLEVEEFVKAAHAHGVPVYPCINYGGTVRLARGAYLEAVRALATNWYRAGADGIYPWNIHFRLEEFSGKLYNHPGLIKLRQELYACLADIGDPKDLMGKDKLFCVDDEVYPPYRHISSKAALPVFKRGPHPQGVLPGVQLLVGEDLEAAAAASLLTRLKLSIEVKGLTQPDAMLFRLNGQKLTGPEVVAIESQESQYQIDYQVTAPPAKMGRNFIEAAVSYDGTSPGMPIEISALRLKVEYKTDR